MKKKVVAAVLCCLCVLWSVQVFAAADTEPNSDPVGIQPMWTNLWNITLSMSYSGGKVNWGGLIAGNANTATISATYTLEKQNSNGTYSPVDSWSDSTTSTILNSSDSKTTPKGTYKLSVSATVTNTSGVSEVATDSLVKTFS